MMMSAMVFAAPHNATTLQGMLGYINSLTDVGQGPILGIILLLAIGAITFLLTKGFGNEKAFGTTGLIVGILGIFLRMMSLISDYVMYIGIVFAVLGVYLVMKEASNYEN